MDQDVNRLIMRFEQLLREVNREIINPQIEELSIEQLRPIAELVARSRASYLKQLYDLSKKYNGTTEFPTEAELKELKVSRERFIDLTDGAKSIEISIQRGYLDLKKS